MAKSAAVADRQNGSGLLFASFGIWSFVLLCRPQDYMTFLSNVRPGITFGVVTLALLLLNSGRIRLVASAGQTKIYTYLVFAMLLSVPFSYYPGGSFSEICGYSAVIISFFLFYQLADSLERLRMLLLSYCIGTAAYAVFMSFPESTGNARMSFGSMFDPNDMAFYLISIFIFNLNFITKENSRSLRLLAGISFLICSIVILQTGSRGGLISFVAVIGCLLLTRHRAVKISMLKRMFLLGAVLVSALFLNTDFERYKTLSDLRSDYNITDETGRLSIWKTGIRLMLAHPVTGVGLGRFPEAVGLDRERRGLDSARWQTAHNSLIQIGAEVGVIGLLLFCTLSYRAYKIFGLIAEKSRNDGLAHISRMARIGFIGHLLSAMFLSQAYSVYWAFYIALSAVLATLFSREVPPVELPAYEKVKTEIRNSFAYES